jgi:hypothetical protein
MFDLFRRIHGPVSPEPASMPLAPRPVAPLPDAEPLHLHFPDILELSRETEREDRMKTNPEHFEDSVCFPAHQQTPPRLAV